ncbi:MAG: hypothetical protein KGN76_01685 [Acidobacteriota bacterium]|nr:hypothetical protein [Acidobacteriota bacterium]
MSSSFPHPAQLYHGLFRSFVRADGHPALARHEAPPASVPDPETGKPLRVATLDAGGPAICPSCTAQGFGGFVSFEPELRLAYACPQCRQFVWLPGA